MVDWINATPLRRRLIALIFLVVSAVVLIAAKRIGLYEDKSLLPAGKMAPDFYLRNKDNYLEHLEAMRSTVVWVIFGRTDDEVTALQLKEARKVLDRYGSQDLAILLLAQSQSREEVQRFVDKYGCPAEVLYDTGGRVAKEYRAKDWPTSYLIDKTGFIRERRRGVWHADDRVLTRGLEEYLRSGMRSSGLDTQTSGGTQP